MKKIFYVYICLSCENVIYKTDAHPSGCYVCKSQRIVKTPYNMDEHAKLIKQMRKSGELQKYIKTVVSENRDKDVDPIPDTENIETTTRFVPKCPICQSTNLKKITLLKKAAKIGAFGIFGMGDNGKTWQCQDCGSKF